jgi:YidC/Oxa1 family membrane protein insertase
MDRNLIYAVLMTTVIIVFFSSPFYQKRFGHPVAPQKIVLKSSAGAAADSIVAPSAPPPQSLTTAPVNPDTTAPPALAQIVPAAERELTLENDVMRIAFSTRGGVITRVTMKKYFGATPNERAQLVIPGKTWSDGFIAEGDTTLPFGSLVFEADSLDTYRVVLRATLAGGRELRRVYTLPSTGYALSMETEFTGAWIDPAVTYEMHGAINQTEPVHRQLSIWPFSMFMNTDPLIDEKLVYLGQGDRTTDERGKQKQKRIYSREGAQNLSARMGEEAVDTFSGDLNWYAVKNKYFMATLIPDQNTRWRAASSYTRQSSGHLFDFTITKKVTDGPVGMSLYMGPILYSDLKAYGHDLPQVMDLSWHFLRPVAVIFLWMFQKLHAFIPNWGLVLIVFSVIIKIVLYPLSKSSLDSMKKMSKIQPQVNELREKHKNDPQRLQKATMELYKQEGVNPFGGCLPVLLQMPVFFALYPVVGRAFELRQAMFIPYWIEDLSRPDPFYILPVALGIQTFLQQRNTIKDPQQKMMLYMMPVMMTILFANFSSGLALYWLMFNVLTWAQQELIK